MLTKKMNLGAAFKSATDIFGKDWVQYVVYTLVMLVVISVGSMILGLIPGFGQLLVQIVTPILYLGFAVVAHDRLSGQNVELSRFFGGFSKFTPLLGLGIVVVCCYALVFGLFFLFFGGALFLDFVAQSQNLAANPDMLEAWMESNLYTMLIQMIPFILLASVIQALFMFSPMFVYFKNRAVFQALGDSLKLATQNPLTVILWILAIIIINTIGVLLCFVGLLFTIPLTYLSQYFLFRQVVGDDMETVVDNSEDILDL